MNLSRRHLRVAICLLLAVCAPATVQSQTKKKPWKDPALNLPVDKIIYAINTGEISVGTDVGQVEKFLDTDREICLPKKGHLNNSNYFTNDNKRWMFSYSWDADGKLVRYALLNDTGKLGPYSDELPNADVYTTYFNKFRSASDELSRLSICKEAMTKNVIYRLMPSEDFNNFIGTHSKVRLPSKKYFYCHYFSENPDCWRLFYCEKEGRISSYFLTKQDGYFSGIPENYWQNEEMTKK